MATALFVATSSSAFAGTFYCYFNINGAIAFPAEVQSSSQASAKSYYWENMKHDSNVQRFGGRESNVVCQAK